MYICTCINRYIQKIQAYLRIYREAHIFKYNFIFYTYMKGSFKLKRKKNGKGHVLSTAARICDPHLAHLYEDDVTSPTDSSEAQDASAKRLPPSHQ